LKGQLQTQISAQARWLINGVLSTSFGMQCSWKQTVTAPMEQPHRARHYPACCRWISLPPLSLHL